jgi:HPt (histidine-containing phosphotransfer) domain-containing protein
MSGNDSIQLKKMLKYLLEEVDIALVEWDKCLLDNNWTHAKRILHREKTMIKSIGIDVLDGLIFEIEDQTKEKSNSEMALMFTQIIQLFRNIKDSFQEVV